MRIKNLLLRTKTWIKQNPLEFWILIGILVVGAFCRLYKIDQYMVFLGDEGRDVIIVRRIFTELHPPLIGPGTSVGSMYLGPLYYYMMALPLLFTGFSPVGPAVMIALLGTITIAFVWWVGRTWFDKATGLIAAALYSIAPTIIVYSHSSWNPNIMPFFALLCVYSIWKVWKKKELNWLIVLGVSLAFVLQSHYLGLLLIPTLFMFWFLTFIELRNKKPYKPFVQKTVIGLICFLVLMSPLLIFDLRHDWMNTKAISKFFMERQTNFSANPILAISQLPGIFNLINKSLIAGKNTVIAVASSVVIAIGIIYLFVKNFIKKKNFKIRAEYALILSWLLFGLIGFGIYKQNIYDHYFGFLFPIPFLLIGVVISKLITGKIYGKILGIAFFLCLIIVNLIGSPLRKEPNKLLQRSLNVSQVIEKNSEGKPFNLAVVADTNYEAGYKYFLLKDNYPVIDIDSQKPGSVVDQLFVVCELLPNSKCDPTHSPKAEIANFGWSRIDDSWEVDGTIVYKLVHTQ